MLQNYDKIKLTTYHRPKLEGQGGFKLMDQNDENTQKALMSGYVYGQEEHSFRIFALIFAPPALLIFDIVLWFQYFKSNLPGLLIFAALFTCFFIGLIFVNLKIRSVDNLQFAIYDNRMINQSKTKLIFLDLDATLTLYCTKETREFAYGKSTQNKVFYLFSDHPFSAEHIDGEGMFFLNRLHQHNILIIPENAQTNAWLAQKYGNITIPDCPRVACLPKPQ